MMIKVDELQDILERLDGKKYGKYKVLLKYTVNYEGIYAKLTKGQQDPYATPAIMEFKIPKNVHKVSEWVLKHEVPLTDYIARKVYSLLKRIRKKRGSGWSGYIGIGEISPCIIKRSCLEVLGEDLILRIYVGLPARGRRILGHQAKELLINDINEVLEIFRKLRKEEEAIKDYIRHYLDQEYIRKWLEEGDYMFFVGEGSILPRESSLSERPLKGAVPFLPPKKMKVRIKLPSGREIEGLAVRRGLLVITGGGYHGKTTLLEAIQRGIYNHVPGDGREWVISRKETMFVKAEDGRIVHNVDISTFISNLPQKASVKEFTTLKASGSTSMAASIIEALEMGIKVILIDEDTSATNLLYKDEIMERLIRNEPIRPLYTQVKEIMEKEKVGFIIVCSASSSFIPKADHVILMDRYLPLHVTEQAKKLVKEVKGNEVKYLRYSEREFLGVKRLKKISTKGYRIILKYDDGKKFELDLSNNPRIVEPGQVKFIASVIRYLVTSNYRGRIKDLMRTIEEKIEREGFKAFTKVVPPDLTVASPLDVVWTLNRLYRASFRQVK